MGGRMLPNPWQQILLGGFSNNNFCGFAAKQGFSLSGKRDANAETKHHYYDRNNIEFHGSPLLLNFDASLFFGSNKIAPTSATKQPKCGERHSIVQLLKKDTALSPYFHR